MSEAGAVMAIIKADKVKLTAGRIADFVCSAGNSRSYLWCNEVKGLGVLATAAGSKSYIFQSKVGGKSVRLTIGGVGAWSIAEAQAEARRLQVQIDTGNDPRQVKAEAVAAKEAEEAAKEAKKRAEEAAKREQEARESLTVGMAWETYLAARKPFWGDRHYLDHEAMMHSGGVQRKFRNEQTKPAPLASLAGVKLADMTPERVTAWAAVERAHRAGRARLAVRLLKAFLNWCAEHPDYSGVVTGNAAKNKKARELLGSPKRMEAVLQREQLPAWFAAVRRLQNPVTAAYLQALLLTGARPGELVAMQWADVDFQWQILTIRDKVEGTRTISLPPYLASLLQALPRRNQFVFSSVRADAAHIVAPIEPMRKVCAEIGVDVDLYGLRRSFATLSEWVETPAGIAAQIQGHKPSGVREKHYIRRPLDLLRKWHTKIEAWILEQAGIEFVPAKAGLRIVTNAK
jgi:integrase